MANVLGALFQDIADAIRGKTGDTATMKPAEFPDKIASIETGGGGDDVAIKTFASFVTLQGQWGERVTLDFGFIPEFILVFPYNVTYGSGKMAYISLSQRFQEQYFSKVASTYYSNVSTASGLVKGSGSNTYLDGTNENSAIYGADDTGFNFGITPGAGRWIVYAIGLPS